MLPQLLLLLRPSPQELDERAAGRRRAIDVGLWLLSRHAAWRRRPQSPSISVKSFRQYEFYSHFGLTLRRPPTATRGPTMRRLRGKIGTPPEARFVRFRATKGFFPPRRLLCRTRSRFRTTSGGGTGAAALPPCISQNALVRTTHTRYGNIWTESSELSQWAVVAAPFCRHRRVKEHVGVAGAGVCLRRCCAGWPHE
ncbi:putative fucose kinase [Trypanosoma conorhini]|uniref:Putative fucose kinase n=1 Tax=Trypanosoma conorhini TaxID=83891 RepID=A0A3R7S1Q1_9TRYP|nr:putative fucose kinase [Trypanosoma conorhini]RNF19292.1 putative fucose kinase [Trypanosoma conorhini]